MHYEKKMVEPKIKCPNCFTEIKLTESLAAPLIQETREKYEAQIAQTQSDISRREAALNIQKQELETAQKSLEEKLQIRVAEARKQIALEEEKKAKAAISEDLDGKTKQLKEMQDLLNLKEEKLSQAQKAQAEIMRKERDLEDKKRELDLTIEKRVNASLSGVHKKARQEAEDALKLKVSEKEEQISSMQRQIDDLKRKAEQGSQQLQGEVLELSLEEDLRTKFPFDVIEPVKKGEFGGDILHTVVNPSGQKCGAILWETKRTKNWSDGWLVKLREDQRTSGADISLLMTHALPKGVETFDLIDNVWVVQTRYALPLVSALRQSLIGVYSTRQAQSGQNTKMEMVYNYLTSTKFRHRVEAIVEKISDMQQDLDKERKMMTRSWAKRDAQIQSVITATVGMYGDLQGIAGQAIQEIEGLDIPLLEDETS